MHYGRSNKRTHMLTRPRRRALLVGINYAGSSCPLSGCVNDVENMTRYLRETFEEIQITTLLDAAATRAAILQSFTELLLSDAQELYFHFSGHGTGVADRDDDEADGQDEAICPVDYASSGVIIDDELNGLLRVLRADQHLTAVLDCCHSGTGMDLGWNLWLRPARDDIRMIEDAKPRPAPRGQVICISGCQDAQTSADAYLNGRAQGALTWALLDFLGDTPYPCPSYRQLVKALFSRLATKGFAQLPNLSAGRPLRLDDSTHLK